MIRSGPRATRAYYKHRAAEYDRIYEAPKYQADLQWLRAWMARLVKGKSVLEVAAGTGYWTQVCSRSARSVIATDYNVETLNVAARRRLGPRVTLVAADALSLPAFKTKFEVGVACLWWSHLKRREQQKFVSHFLSRLVPGGKLLLIDEAYRKGTADSISRHDRFGNRYELRVTANNVLYEIVKNIPDDSDLRQTLSDLCRGVRIKRLKHYWALSAQARTPK
jgi:ubiquinone/menaquinone biosynthesis C-methylase UbiE